jgi:hypothetical protein
MRLAEILLDQAFQQVLFGVATWLLARALRAAAGRVADRAGLPRSLHGAVAVLVCRLTRRSNRAAPRLAAPAAKATCRARRA